ncbi:sugar phosphate nucleotidyltransferase [Elusimicrobiota bacterium]
MSEFARGLDPELSARVSREESPLGTGGALELCRELVEGPAVLVMNGDSYCPLDLGGLVAFHSGHEGVASIAMTEAGERRDVGFIGLAEKDRIVSFDERGAVARHLNAGVYVLDREVLDGMSPGPRSLEREVFPGLLERGVYGHLTREKLWDIGTPERLEEFRKVFPG